MFLNFTYSFKIAYFGYSHTFPSSLYNYLFKFSPRPNISKAILKHFGQNIELTVIMPTEDMYFMLDDMYRNTNGKIVVYSCESMISFGSAMCFLRNIREKEVVDTPIALIGTECDSIERCTKWEEAKEYADKYGALFLETSEKVGDNIRDILEMLFQSMIENIGSNQKTFCIN
jgi:GTPase SAR1 family protein